MHVTLKQAVNSDIPQIFALQEITWLDTYLLWFLSNQSLISILSLNLSPQSLLELCLYHGPQ